MLALVLASLSLNTAVPASDTIQPGLICRPIVVGASRSGDIKICRTKAEWRRAEGCTGVTRYCPRKRGGMYGKQTAFGLSDDSRIVCRIVKATGSRLANQQLCLAKREWDRMFIGGSEEATRLINQKSSMGDDLPK